MVSQEIIMAEYYLYGYSFDKLDQASLWGNNECNDPIKDGQMYMEKGLPNLFTYKAKGTPSEQRLENTVKRSEKLLTTLVLCNNRKRKYQEGKEDRELQFHPGCWVIIDNRTEHRLIAIEKSESFHRKPDSVRKILENAINGILVEYGLKIIIEPTKSKGEFFDQIERRINVKGNIIKYIKLDVPSREKIEQLRADDETKQKILTLNSISEMVKAQKSVYKAISDTKDGLVLDRSKSEIVGLVTACVVNNYSVSVNFSKTGLFKSTSLNKAIDHLEDRIVNDFNNGCQTLGLDKSKKCELEQWFDDFLDKNKTE